VFDRCLAAYSGLVVCVCVCVCVCARACVRVRARALRRAQPDTLIYVFTVIWIFLNSIVISAKSNKLL
jgi:hypothetical protein